MQQLKATGNVAESEDSVTFNIGYVSHLRRVEKKNLAILYIFIQANFTFTKMTIAVSIFVWFGVMD